MEKSSYQSYQSINLTFSSLFRGGALQNVMFSIYKLLPEHETVIEGTDLGLIEDEKSKK